MFAEVLRASTLLPTTSLPESISLQRSGKTRSTPSLIRAPGGSSTVQVMNLAEHLLYMTRLPKRKL